MICPNSGHTTSPKPFVVCIACRQMVAVAWVEAMDAVEAQRLIAVAEERP